MVSSEVQRTLVKSPPELWAELSDPAALARHLGELGEIRIVRTNPESTVEWEAENLTGSVSIKPSGWGTKVTLTVTRAAPESSLAPESSPAPEIADVTSSAIAPGTPEGVAANALPEAAAQAAAEGSAAGAPPDAAVAETALEAAGDASPEPVAVLEAAGDAPPQAGAGIMPAASPAPEERRRGFFARLFGRRSRRRDNPTEPAANEATQPAGESAPAPPSPTPQPSSEPDSPSASGAPIEPADDAAGAPDDQPTADISAELAAAEEIAAEEVTAVLTAVLDRLGAAHHRPFSRA